MDRQTDRGRSGKGIWIKTLVPAIIALIVIRVFSPEAPEVSDKAFNIKECLASIPEEVKGLKVLEGPRTKAIIIKDMAPLACKARGIFHRMNHEGADIAPGSMSPRVRVEFNGEVISVKIEQSDIKDKILEKKVIALIGISDFTYCGRQDTDAVFLYPIHFGRG